MKADRQVTGWSLVGVLVLAGIAAFGLRAESASDPLDQLKPGEWYEVPNSKLQAVLPSPPARGTPAAIMNTWNGGAWDPVRQALVLAANGGHADYGGNEVYAFFLSSLTWQRLTEPSVAGPPTQTSETLPDGLPASRHTYSGVTFLLKQDKVFTTGGSLWGSSGGGSRGAWTFDVPSRKWERQADAPGSQVTAMAAYDPITGLVFSLIQNGTLGAYDPAKNAWSNRGGPGTWAEYDPARTMVLHPKRRALLVIGGGHVMLFDISRSHATPETISTTGGAPIVDAQGPGLAYDPVTDRIVGWAGGGDVYSATEIDENVWLYKIPERRGSRVEATRRWAWLDGYLSGVKTATAAEGPGAKLDIPLRTWVSRPLPTGTAGPIRFPTGASTPACSTTHDAGAWCSRAATISTPTSLTTGAI